MINITQLKALAEQCVVHTALNHAIWVTTEAELSRKVPNLKASQFPLLVFVTPSFEQDAPDSDNAKDVATLLFFVLINGRFQAETEITQQNDMNNTLEIIGKIKQYLLNGFPDSVPCSIVDGVIPYTFHIDPEFNYLGCNGWSMSFQIKT